MYTSSTLQSQLSIHDSVSLLFAGSQGVDQRCDWEGMDLSCMCGQAVWVQSEAVGNIQRARCDELLWLDLWLLSACQDHPIHLSRAALV